MRRKVYLKGQIEKKFGSEFTINSSSFSDVIKCIDCNRPGFKKYLLECHENDIAFAIKAAGKDIEDQDLLSPLKEGDITIAALPAGSKSDGMKIVTAIALIYISTLIGPEGAYALGGKMGAFVAKATMAVGINLAMQGIQGMLAPDPATEDQEDEGYLYTGDTNIIVEGDPVPLLYGELRVAGQPISIAINNIASGGYTPEQEDRLVHTTTDGFYTGSPPELYGNGINSFLYGGEDLFG